MPRSQPTSPRERARALESDPLRRYRSDLVAIIREVAALPGEGPLAPAVLDRILKRHPRAGRGLFSRSQLIEGYRCFAPGERFAIDEETFVERVRLRRVRSLSGVTPVTVFTRPHPCPGRCVFCPNDVRMPKSYLSDEPGAQRAAENGFDPYRQTWSRLAAYRAIGHPTDKVELIVLGGTWSFHPEAYQRWFVKRMLDALDDFGRGIDRRDAAPLLRYDALPERLDGRAHRDQVYNRLVGRHVPETVDAEAVSWEQLARAQRRNEDAAARCVGLVVETRPDELTLAEVERIRRLGATKVQIGIQSLDDGVLAANRRGHDVATTHRALALLRGAGFKLHAHWMPNLLKATPESDRADFDRLFDDARVRPDELKVYPCSLVESAELVQHYERGEWSPYEHDELLDVVVHALRRAPRWARLTRVIRDISSDDIVVGNKLTNFREIAQSERWPRRGAVPPATFARARFAAHSFEADATCGCEATGYATSIGWRGVLSRTRYARGSDRRVSFACALPEAGAMRRRSPEVLPELRTEPRSCGSCTSTVRPRSMSAQRRASRGTAPRPGAARSWH